MRGALDRAGSSLRASAAPWEVVVFAWLPAIALGVVFFSELRWGRSLGNFATFRAASLSVLHGHSPFPAPDASGLAGNDAFVYPPVTAFLFAPFAVVPLEAGRVLIMLATAASVLIALRLLNVRDWRCYGLALLTAPALGSVSIGALSPFLLAGAAATWRFRHRPLVTGTAAALTAVAKLFLWPLWVWLLATRRFRAAAVAAIGGAALVVAGWAAIGFTGLGSYPHLLRALSGLEAPESYSLLGLVHLSRPATAIASIALAGLVAAAVIAAASGDDGERRSFAIAVAGALLATPVLWLHYFVLLLIPIALYRPRLSPLWFAPLAFWVTPFAHSDGSVWRTCYVLAVAAAIVAHTFVPANARRRRQAPAAAGPIAVRDAR